MRHEERERGGEGDVHEHHRDVHRDARDHRDQELPVPVGARRVVDPLRRAHEPRPALGAEPGADAAANVAPVDHEVDREHEDHEGGERAAGEGTDETENRVDAAEEVGDVLGAALRRLDLILGAQALHHARVLKALGVLRDLVREVLRPVDHRREHDQADDEQDQAEDDDREGDAHALADLRPPGERLGHRVDREREEAGGQDPDDDVARHDRHADERRDEEHDADNDGRVVGKLAPARALGRCWKSLALAHVNGTFGPGKASPAPGGGWTTLTGVCWRR